MTAERYAGKVGRPSRVPVSIVPGGAGTPIPKAPRMGAAGTEAWKRLWTVGRSWLSNEAHYDLMVQVCETLDRRAELMTETRKRTFKRIVRGSMGQDRVNPIYEAIDRADAKVVDLLVKLRFQPAEQKQGVAAPPKTRMDAMREARRATGQ